MEKKTFGSFLSALRKANGMTQQDLADRLGVSNKAVSRWERDENYPDLTLLPVIAEIFNVTTDELLSGEKKAAPQAEVAEAQSASDKKRSEKQVKVLLKKQENKWIRNVAICGAVFAACVILCIAIASSCDTLSYGSPWRILENASYALAIISFLVFVASPIVEYIKFKNYVYAFDDCAEDIAKAQKRFFITTWVLESLFCLTVLIVYESMKGFPYYDIIPEIIVEVLLAEAVAFLILQIVRKNLRGAIALGLEIPVLIALLLVLSKYYTFSSKYYIIEKAESTEYTSMEEFAAYAESNPNPHVPAFSRVELSMDANTISVDRQMPLSDGTYTEPASTLNFPEDLEYYNLYTVYNRYNTETSVTFALKNEDILSLKFYEENGILNVTVVTESAYKSASTKSLAIFYVLVSILVICGIALPLAGFIKIRKTEKVK